MLEELSKVSDSQMAQQPTRLAKFDQQQLGAGVVDLK